MNPELVSLFDAAARQSVSDIHLIPGEPPRFRWNGELTPVTDIAPISQEALLSAFPLLVRSALRSGTMPFAETVIPCNDLSFVVYAYRSGGDFAATIRVMMASAPKLEQIGGDYVAQFTEFARAKQGFLMVTGPVGSGKHTTAFAILQEINSTQPRRIHLLEESPAHWLHSDMGLVSSIVVGQDVPDYETALRLLIRGGDPDVIFLADLPSAEVVQQALNLVRMGCLVVASASATSASEALATLCHALNPEILPTLRDHLLAVTNQRLMRRANGSGRVPAYEILRGDMVRGFIHAGAEPHVFQEIFLIGGNEAVPLRDTVVTFLQKGDVTQEDAATALHGYPMALSR